MGYKFYYVKTHHTLDWIEQTLYRVGYATNQVVLRVIKDRAGRETNGTVAYLDESVYFKLLQECRKDFLIEPFVVPRVFHPNPEKYTYNWCIPFLFNGQLPPDMGMTRVGRGTTSRDAFYVQQIELLLGRFISQGVIPHDGHEIIVPVTSRARSETKAIAFVSFHETISRDTIAVMRYLMDDSRWPWVPEYKLTCLWARQPN